MSLIIIYQWIFFKYKCVAATKQRNMYPVFKCPVPNGLIILDMLQPLICLYVRGHYSWEGLYVLKMGKGEHLHYNK